MTLSRVTALSVMACAALASGILDAATPPAIRYESGFGRLIVSGKPFLILGGELGNSSAGTAAEAERILPKLASEHFNTVLVPVTWQEIEPAESHFDFSVLDHWVMVAREQRLHLVLLWFGSWKNAFSNDAPVWVRSDTERFPRAISADGLPLEILSTLADETRRCDARAFSALMRHLRETDRDQQTVLMLQVENEMGYLGRGRDRSTTANKLFQSSVPLDLKRALEARRAHMSPEIAAHFNPAGQTWKEMFGEAADEVFMAWHYARFVNQVAAEGKKEYALPMYLNAQLPAPFERSGEYPSGGPHPYDQDIYRIAAPSIDFYSPDIYWPNFEYWVQRYEAAGNPVFVPEARLDAAPYNALYVYGEARGFGFSPFGVESLMQSGSPHAAEPRLADVYGALQQLSAFIIDAQQKKQIRAVVLHAASARPTQTVSLGGYLFQGSLSRSWPARNLLTDDGAMLVLQTKPDEFYVVGSGLTVDFFRDPDTDDRVAGIADIEQVSASDGKWATDRVLIGDQTNQGRQLLMSPHEVHIYRVALYTYSRARLQ